MAFQDEAKKKAYQLVVEEKGYSGRLSTLGKVACFCEYFDGMKMEDEDIQRVVPVEKPRDSMSFKDGFRRADTMLQYGFTQYDYNNFLNNLREKEIIESIIDVMRQRKEQLERNISNYEDFSNGRGRK